MTTAGRMASGLETEHTLGPASRLEVVVDPAAYLANVDFEALAESAAQGATVRIEKDTPSYDAIVLQMTAGRRVDLVWE